MDSTEVQYTGENSVRYHMRLVKKLQDPFVEFICSWYGFAVVEYIGEKWFSLATAQSFEEVARCRQRRPKNEKGLLKPLDFVNFPSFCMALFQKDSMQSLQAYEKNLAKLFSSAPYFRINLGDDYFENIFAGCMNVEMAKLKIAVMPELAETREALAEKI